MLSVGRDRPLEPDTLEVLRQVDRVAWELALSYFLVGAMARDILLHGVFGLAIGRATRDVDLGVLLQGWPQFEALKARLVGTGAFVPDPGTAHRLRHRTDPKRPGAPLDLIPFGGVEHRAHEVAWPPDGSVVMNVAGYREALAAATPIEVAPDFVVRVASVPGLAILKLVAWVDRGQGDPRDAIDLGTLLQQHGAAGNEDRLYGAEMGILERVDYDLDLAGARLLGRDAGQIVTPTTRGQILAVLDDPARLDRLVVDVARGLRAADDPMTVAEALLAQFKAGFQGA